MLLGRRMHEAGRRGGTRKKCDVPTQLDARCAVACVHFCILCSNIAHHTHTVTRLLCFSSRLPHSCSHVLRCCAIVRRRFCQPAPTHSQKPSVPRLLDYQPCASSHGL